MNDNPDETMTFLLHLSEDGKSSEDNHSVRLTTKWIFHPTHDLCFTYCAVLDDAIPKITVKNVFRKSINSQFIRTKEQLKELTMSEAVTMVGYSNGLWDELHNFPIFRHGYTAAHPGYDFNKEGI